jgi:hypothetical protein
MDFYCLSDSPVFHAAYFVGSGLIPKPRTNQSAAAVIFSFLCASLVFCTFSSVIIQI